MLPARQTNVTKVTVPLPVGRHGDVRQEQAGMLNFKSFYLSTIQNSHRILLTAYRLPD